MGLLEEIKADTTGSGMGCATCAWIASRDADEAAEWRAAIADKTYSGAAIWRAMKRRGFRLSNSALTAHRSQGHGRE